MWGTGGSPSEGIVPSKEVDRGVGRGPTGSPVPWSSDAEGTLTVGPF